MLPHWDITAADPGAVETGRPRHGAGGLLRQSEEVEIDITICLLSGRQRFEVGINK